MHTRRVPESTQSLSAIVYGSWLNIHLGNEDGRFQILVRQLDAVTWAGDIRSIVVSNSTVRIGFIMMVEKFVCI